MPLKKGMYADSGTMTHPIKVCTACSNLPLSKEYNTLGHTRPYSCVTLFACLSQAEASSFSSEQLVLVRRWPSVVDPLSCALASDRLAIVLRHSLPFLGMAYSANRLFPEHDCAVLRRKYDEIYQEAARISAQILRELFPNNHFLPRRGLRCADCQFGISPHHLRVACGRSQPEQPTQ